MPSAAVTSRPRSTSWTSGSPGSAHRAASRRGRGSPRRSGRRPPTAAAAPAAAGSGATRRGRRRRLTPRARTRSTRFEASSRRPAWGRARSMAPAARRCGDAGEHLRRGPATGPHSRWTGRPDAAAAAPPGPPAGRRRRCRAGRPGPWPPRSRAPPATSPPSSRSTAAAKSGATTGAAVDLVRPVTAGDQQPRGARRPGGIDVGADVAHDGAPLDGHPERRRSPVDHPGAGLRQRQPSVGRWGHHTIAPNGPSRSSTHRLTASTWVGGQQAVGHAGPGSTRRPAEGQRPAGARGPRQPRAAGRPARGRRCTGRPR